MAGRRPQPVGSTASVTDAGSNLFWWEQSGTTDMRIATRTPARRGLLFSTASANEKNQIQRCSTSTAESLVSRKTPSSGNVRVEKNGASIPGKHLNRKRRSSPQKHLCPEARFLSTMALLRVARTTSYPPMPSFRRSASPRPPLHDWHLRGPQS